jgi:signal transduction histidine kinase
MTKRPRWSIRLFVAFGAVVLSFVAATAFEHWRLIAIDRAARDIADNASPSIERLTAARGDLRRIQVLLREHLDRKSLGQASDGQAIEQARREMDRAISEYLSLTPFPDEQSFWAGILRGQDELHDAVTRCILELDHGDVRAADATARTAVSSASEHLAVAIALDVDFNAARAHDRALEIQRVRGQSTIVAFGLDGLCALVALGGAIALHRAMRAHADLVESHQQLLEHRASELEQFAGSVAHDILSPLNAVGLSLELAGTPGEEAARAGWIKRGTSSLARVERLVSGLLDFARAGAPPGSGALCDVRSTIADLAPDLHAAALDAGAELDVDIQTTSGVRCNAGVLTSIVANLARNAIKYIGDGPLRRIEVRAHDAKGKVRVEVQDSGPGLPEGFESRAFDPYIRGPHATQPGIGLGLATVKRLVEAHGGQVGVVSVAGRGCTFWFELPAAIGPQAPETAEGTETNADASSSVRHAH